jgi:hypothetical protein
MPRVVAHFYDPDSNIRPHAMPSFVASGVFSELKERHAPRLTLTKWRGWNALPLDFGSPMMATWKYQDFCVGRYSVCALPAHADGLRGYLRDKNREIRRYNGVDCVKLHQLPGVLGVCVVIPVSDIPAICAWLGILSDGPADRAELDVALAGAAETGHVLVKNKILCVD